MAKISPSILAADFANLERDIRDIEANGADFAHVDIMDVPGTTDVITMAYLEEPEALFPGDLGLELLICVPFAEREGAERADSSMADELVLYLVHGCLHAAGENDLVESDRVNMRRREAEVLAELRKKYVFSEIFPE